MIYKATCSGCGHEWRETETPVACPKCCANGRELTFRLSHEHPVRERCLYCDQKLRVEPRSPFEHPGYGGNGLFCTLRHAAAWAVEVARLQIRTGAL